MWGELACLASAACWASASLIYRRLGKETRPMALNLLKSGLATLLLAGTLLAVEGWRPPGWEQLGWLALSGLVGLTIGDSLYFGALTTLGPRKTLLIWSLAPALTAALAWPVLGEPVTAGMLGGMALTLGGIALVITDREGAGVGVTTKKGVLLALGATACQAVGCVLTKLGDDGVSSLAISTIRLGAAVPVLLVLVLLAGQGSDLAKGSRPGYAGKLVAGCLVGTYAGLWLSMYGLTRIDAGVAVTLSTTTPLFILPLVALFEKERIGPRAILGALVAVGGVAVLLLAA